jgi:uncharacterized lipoprotein YbaY/uncharacterized membrane protein
VPEHGRLSGTVTYRERIALPPGSIVQVQLIDVSGRDGQGVVLAGQMIAPSHQVPISFELEFDPAKIDPSRHYALRATISDPGGQLMWVTPEVVPVRPGESSSDIQIIVQRAGEAAADGEDSSSTGRDPWENARLRGVFFRGSGNEPGWFVEISGSGSSGDIDLVADYGDVHLTFQDAPRVTKGNPATAIYSAQEGDHSLQVVIEPVPCTDSMSGQPFAQTVTMQLDGREYHGCGRYLS